MLFQLSFLTSSKKIFHNINVRRAISKYHNYSYPRIYCNDKGNNKIQNIKVRTKTRKYNRFFIESSLKNIVAHHNDLKQDLASLSQSLIIHKKSGRFIPEWIQEIEIDSNLYPNFNVGQLIKNHILEDKPNLLDRIYSYEKELFAYIQDVKKFRYLIDAMVKNRFIEKNLLPDKDYFHKEDFNLLMDIRLTSILRCIQNGKDLSKLKDELKITITRKSQNELWLNDFHIGNGNEIDGKNMEDIINDLPSNRLILKGLSDINQSIIKLEKESEDIRMELGQIMTQIKKGRYETLVACCPTQDKTIYDQ